MSNVILFNPSIATSNVGDKIIFYYSDKAIKSIFPNDAIIEFPTQMPVSNKILNRFRPIEYRFICGSNLLQSNMAFKLGRKGIITHGIRQWDISLSNAKKYAPTVLLGVGWQNYNTNVNAYTKALWRKVLSQKYIHSVRDDFTVERLKSIGIDNVINTGCPTTWALTPKFCKEIPTKKAKNAITTVTDYRPDRESDQQMLRTVIESYDKVWLWLQGIDDAKYFEGFDEDIKRRIILLGPQLDIYRNILLNNDVDYIGTRLHGGIYALNHKKRAIIIGVDNRAIEMNKDINLKVIKRENMHTLASEIQSEWQTDIRIRQENISLFTDQFNLR